MSGTQHHLSDTWTVSIGHCVVNGQAKQWWDKGLIRVGHMDTPEGCKQAWVGSGGVFRLSRMTTAPPAPPTSPSHHLCSPLFWKMPKRNRKWSIKSRGSLDWWNHLQKSNKAIDLYFLVFTNWRVWCFWLLRPHLEKVIGYDGERKAAVVYRPQLWSRMGNHMMEESVEDQTAASPPHCKPLPRWTRGGCFDFLLVVDPPLVITLDLSFSDEWRCIAKKKKKNYMVFSLSNSSLSLAMVHHHHGRLISISNQMLSSEQCHVMQGAILNMV